MRLCGLLCSRWQSDFISFSDPLHRVGDGEVPVLHGLRSFVASVDPITSRSSGEVDSIEDTQNETESGHRSLRRDAHAARVAPEIQMSASPNGDLRTTTVPADESTNVRCWSAKRCLLACRRRAAVASVSANNRFSKIASWPIAFIRGGSRLLPRPPSERRSVPLALFLANPKIRCALFARNRVTRD